MGNLNSVFVEQDMKLTMYLKEKQKHSSVDGAPNPASARHALPPSSAVATPCCTAGNDSNLLLLHPYFRLSCTHFALCFGLD